MTERNQADAEWQDSRLPRCRWVVLLCTLSCIMTTGCQQGMYQATALPTELNVQPLVDIQTLDLGRISNSYASSQRIHAGDQLQLTIVTGAETEKPEAWPVRVREDGIAEVPLVGPIQLAGHDLQSAQTAISLASIDRGVFKRPTVSLTVDERRTNRITVLGAVEEPGGIDLDAANSDLLTAIGVAGGLTFDADTVVEISQPIYQPAQPQSLQPSNSGRQDQIAQVSYESSVQSSPAIRLPVGQSQRNRVDLVAATASPPPAGFPLRDGSVVIVRKRPKRFVHVMGLVNRPNQFELPPNQNIRVLDALALAQGRTFSLADRVFVVRPIPHNSKPALIEVSVREAKENNAANILLANGDVVSVEETPVTMALGVLNQFIRFGFNGSVRVF